MCKNVLFVASLKPQNVKNMLAAILVFIKYDENTHGEATEAPHAVRLAAGRGEILACFLWF